MSLYNVVPNHIRFNINMPVLTSKKQFKRSHVTTGETKKTKIQKSKIPKLLDFLVFLGFFLFFLVFQQKPKISHVFLILGGNPKKQVFLLFLFGLW